MRSISLAVLALLGMAVAAAAQDIPGARPSYDGRELSDVPNAQAITARVWMPGLDEGFVPQGLTVMGGTVYVAAYRSAERAVDRGLGRVFLIDAGSGALKGHFDLPARFGHPGGLANDGTHLYAADRGRLARIDVAAALRGDGEKAILAERTIDKKLGPSFLTYDGTLLWFGPYERAGGQTLYGIAPAELFDPAKAHETLSEISRTLPIPPLVQGAAFDAQGRLWLSTSGSRFGKLHRLDPRTGAIEAEFDMPAGIEDIGRDEQGRLWSVSESGTRRWQGWTTFYPLVFRFDPALLK